MRGVPFFFGQVQAPPWKTAAPRRVFIVALALYRKYRPATFAEVVGQDHVTEPLRTALASGRINHAYLFSGPRGCGKTSSARILARSLNCAEGPTPDPCGKCDSCIALAPEGPGSVDVVELDAASHGGVDDTRELRDRAFYAPAQSRYRIFIIDEAHMVTTQGFNALLKIVEEPPEHLIFIFATTEPDKVLTTIRSRTHHYPFRLLPPSVMRDLVEKICREEGVQVDPAVYPLVIRAGGGSARDTLSVLDQLLAGADDRGVTYERAVALLGVSDVALIDEMVDALAAEDPAAVYGAVDRLVEAGHDPRRFAADLLDRFRDLLLLQSVPDAAQRGLVEVAGEELSRMQHQAEQLGPATLTRFAEIVHSGLSEMRGATAPRLQLELLCSRMLLPSASESEAALLQRLERLERRMTIAPVPEAGGDQPAPRKVYQRPSERAAEPAPETAEPVGAPPAEQRSATDRAPAERESAPRQPAPEEAARPAQPQQSTAPQQQSTAPPRRSAPAEQDTAPPPAEPAAEQAPQHDAASVRRVWTELLRAVSQRNRPTQALLLNASVQALHNGTLVLSMPTPGLVKQLAQQRRLDFVRDALREVLGGEWEIQIVEAGAAPAAPQPAPKPQRPAAPPERPSRPSAPQAKLAATVPSAPEPDDIPPPPEPPAEEPPPDDIPPEPEPAPPPAPDQPEDPDELLAESTTMDGQPVRDPEAEAVELFIREFGARKLDD